MPQQPYVTYRKFNDVNAALALGELFDEAAIEYLLEDYSVAFNPTFANNEQDKEFRIKLKQQDFKAADTLQEAMYESVLEDIEEDYYLFSFTNKELYEVITKSDEWSKLDYLLARKILRDRGEAVDDNLVKVLKEIRLDELARPEESSDAQIIMGYIFALFGGFIGLFIGWYLVRHKKTLPNGERIYGNSPADRKHGLRIIVISILSFTGWMFLKLRAGS